jgi:hypothetical protein
MGIRNDKGPGKFIMFRLARHNLYLGGMRPPCPPNEEIAGLRARVALLEEEISFLRTHPVFVQGLKGETLVAEITTGTLTAFAEGHDVLTYTQKKVEVKFSKLNRPRGVQHPIRRWNWSKPFGWKDKGKDFDYLLLVGEKDLRYLDQYPAGPYVFFLLPKDSVPKILTKGAAIGSNVQLTTNLATVRSPASLFLKQHLTSVEVIKALMGPGPAVQSTQSPARRATTSRQASAERRA